MNIITDYIFGKVADITFEHFNDVDKRDLKSLKQAVEDFKTNTLQRHKENPDFEVIEDFWREQNIVLEMIKIRYSLDSLHTDYERYRQVLEDRFKHGNRKLCFDILDDFNMYLKKEVKTNSNFSNSDIAVMDELMRSNSTELNSTLNDILDQLKLMVSSNNNKSVDEYINQSKINNLKLIPALASGFTINYIGDYKYNYHLMPSISFEGRFGHSPTVYMIYSENDESISLRTQEQGLQPENLAIRRLIQSESGSGYYSYSVSKEICYYSNKSEFDVRPFVFVILGGETFGFLTLTAINKSFKSGLSMNVPYTGNSYFVPQVRKLVWPKEKDLLKQLKEPQTGRAFYLEKEQVDDVMSIKKYFLNTLKKEVQDALVREYE